MSRAGLTAFTLISLAALLSAGPALAADTKNAPTLPPGVTIPKDVQLPVKVSVAVYVPAGHRKSRFFVPGAGFWMEPGKALEDGLGATLAQFFSGGFLADPSNEQPYGLLLAIHPQWHSENGNLRLTMNYKAFGAENAVVLEGTQTASVRARYNGSGSDLYAVALKTSQLAAADVVTKLRPDTAKYPAAHKLKDVNPELFVNREKPVATGTGFFINTLGQIVTAAHVLKDCAVLEVKRENQTMNARLVASSTLLDLAIIDTASPVERFLPLRKNAEIILGEPVANVGYPLQSILAATPNLTRGNVSSRGALEGAVGQFQFSAPIQPGSSGGPVVSDGGELLGITVSTLSIAPLIERGVLPQNVNFALDAKYAAMFLKRHNIAFTEVEPNLKGDMRMGNDAALSTVVRLACFQ